MYVKFGSKVLETLVRRLMFLVSDIALTVDGLTIFCAAKIIAQVV